MLSMIRRGAASRRHLFSSLSRAGLGLALVLGVFAVISVPAAQATGNSDPGGNNGTVKIVEDGDFDSIPNNHPHVGCTFTVEWYGFDKGSNIISTVTFEMQAPTQDVGLTVDGPPTVFVGADNASGAGTPSGLDGRQKYTLSFAGPPHPIQGYHLKLTIQTPGSHGNDKKYKVFWVEGCEPPNPSILMTKSVADSNDADAVGSLGELLTYSFSVTNTGNVPLNNVRITDPMIPALASGAPCVASLAPGASTTCPLISSATHTVAAADIANGSVHNTATATGSPPTGANVSAQDSATIATPAVPSLRVTKSVSDSNDADSLASQGEVLTYSFVVTNTGNVPLSNVRITDPMIPALVSGGACAASLAVGASTTCPLITSATHTTTAADVSHGSVDNTATATGTPPTGPNVTGQGSATIPTYPNASALMMTKSVTDSADADSVGSLGEVLTYTFSVINTGNLPLTDVTISDPLLGISNAPCVSSLAVGATTSCPLLATPPTHTVTAAEVANGSVDNTATASGTPPEGPRVTTTGHASIPTGSPGTVNLSIDKSVDVSQAAPGDLVTYTLRVHNTGSEDADEVVVTDTLPAGTSYVSSSAPCTHAGQAVTCNLGTVVAGGSETVTIQVEVDPVATGDTTHRHQLDYTKIESHLSLFDGDTGSATATCPTGYLATDGSVRLDAVDQGTGTFADAVVLASGATADGRGWTGTVHNEATGQVQAKVNVVCATERTTSGEDHSHPLLVSAPVTTTQVFTSGRSDVDLTCAPDSYAITPSFAFTSGIGILSTRRTPTGWRFSVDVADSAEATLGVRCLSTALGTSQGHSHDLTFTQLSDTVTVPAGQVVERRLTCPDGYKGIVAWADLDHGLISLGNDPQPITRVYRFYNPTDSALSADFGLLCVAIRTNGGSGTDGAITNTAHVSTSTPNEDTADNSDSATFQVTSGSRGLTVASVATVSSSSGHTRVMIPVTSARTRGATTKLIAIQRVQGTRLHSGSLLARSTTKLHAGKHSVRLTARHAAAHALRQGAIRKAKLVIITRDGHRTVWIVKIRA